MRIEIVCLTLGFLFGAGAFAADPPPSCKSPTHVAFRAKLERDHDCEARLKADGWHLSDDDGGDIFVGQDCQICVKGDDAVHCGKDIGNGSAGGQDVRDAKEKRNHGTILSWRADDPSNPKSSGSLVISPKRADGSIDSSLPSLKILPNCASNDDDSASAGQKQKAKKPNGLSIQIYRKDPTYTVDGEMRLDAPEKIPSAIAKDSDYGYLTGSQCRVNGLEKNRVTVDEKNKFSKTDFNGTKDQNAVDPGQTHVADADTAK